VPDFVTKSKRLGVPGLAQGQKFVMANSAKRLARRSQSFECGSPLIGGFGHEGTAIRTGTRNLDCRACTKTEESQERIGYYEHRAAVRTCSSAPSL